MPTPALISASRRTDVPAFYADWFMNRIAAGSVTVPNPFNGKDARISLRPEDVRGIVFWSRCYARLLPRLPELKDRGYRFYAHYTITGLPRNIEPRGPDWRKAVRTFRRLAEATDPRAVLWRFDPIVLTDGLDAALHLRRFREIAEALAGFTRRCIFSFVYPYAKVKRRFDRACLSLPDADLDVRRGLVLDMAGVAERHGIGLYACCQEPGIAALVKPAACVDDRLFAEVYADAPVGAKPAPSRAGCGCVESRDVGVYDTCPFGCLYCYANQSPGSVQARWRSHDPRGERLIPFPS